MSLITSKERHIREPIWYLDSGCSRSMTSVKSYLHKYVEQPGPKFDDKQGTIFNAKKEIVLIALRRNGVYVLDMSSLTPNGACFFPKASESFIQRINLAQHVKKGITIELHSKLNKTSLSHLLHMDLFGPVSPMSINHEKYTLFIIDEYSRYTWVYFLRKKSQAPEMIMSFIWMVENQNDIKVKQIRTDNGIDFRNHEL
ncbi:retrovirus-related pol polyprotein from transposon TNT 1-94 [Tanacetum coccineum]